MKVTILFFSIFFCLNKNANTQNLNLSDSLKIKVFDPDSPGRSLDLIFSKNNSGEIYFSEDCGIFISDSLVGNRFFVWDSLGNILQADAKGDYSFSVYSENLFTKGERYFYKIKHYQGSFIYMCD